MRRWRCVWQGGHRPPCPSRSAPPGAVWRHPGAFVRLCRRSSCELRELLHLASARCFGHLVVASCIPAHAALPLSTIVLSFVRRSLNLYQYQYQYYSVITVSLTYHLSISIHLYSLTIILPNSIILITQYLILTNTYIIQFFFFSDLLIGFLPPLGVPPAGLSSHDPAFHGRLSLGRLGRPHALRAGSRLRRSFVPPPGGAFPWRPVGA
jgi:hypothetical protein